MWALAQGAFGLIGGWRGVLYIAAIVVLGFWLLGEKGAHAYTRHQLSTTKTELAKTAEKLTKAENEVAQWKASFGELEGKVAEQNASLDRLKASSDEALQRAAVTRQANKVLIAKLASERDELKRRIADARAEQKTAQDAADEIRALLIAEKRGGAT